MLFNTELLKSLIQFAQESKKHIEIFKLSAKKYHIENLKLEKVPPKSIVQTLTKNGIFENQKLMMEETLQNSSKSAVWGHFQFKAFSWITIILCFYIKKGLHQFGEEEVTFLRSSFPDKSKEFIMYNIESLIKQNSKMKNKWTEQQSAILREIMNEKSPQQLWSSISFQLFIRSNCQFFRPRDKCRQQWTNHLASKLNKEKWTLEEDILLMKSAIKFGKKWSRISKIFEGTRTEHMVKNRYNALTKKARKHLGKIKDLEDKILIQLECNRPKQSSEVNNENIQISSQIVDEDEQKSQVILMNNKETEPIIMQNEGQLLDCWIWNSFSEQIPQKRQQSQEKLLNFSQKINFYHYQEEDIFNVFAQ